tara:strand:- start:279 stop:551 length:273 start_codon:yes stop_codon:yes gene_type:complete
MYAPNAITSDGFITVEGETYDIAGSQLEFNFTGTDESAEVLMAMMTEEAMCHNCNTLVKDSLLLSTTIGEILACRACNEFVRVIEGEVGE